MSSSVNCQKLFLWCMASIYLFAFGSLYFQIPGLYGRKGLLPAELQLTDICKDSHTNCPNWASESECVKNPTWMQKNCELSCHMCKPAQASTLGRKFEKKITFLWLSPYIGLNVETGMEMICILGVILSVAALISQRFCNKLDFTLLWLLYLSVYQVGQTFLWFQWDILLLETGFLTVFVAPLFFTAKNDAYCITSFWLLKWLLFRLMFASGVVKLTSMCPTWWGLTALNWHYESQCIPTPVAWYAHQLPHCFHQLSTVATYVIEIMMPFLFFVPVRSLRLLSFYSQVLLQVLIIVTGNYNFFNLLTLSLCISLLDDEHLWKITPNFCKRYFAIHSNPKKKSTSRLLSIIANVVFGFILVLLIYLTKKYFNIQWNGGMVFHSKIAFGKSDFLSFVTKSTKASILLAVACFTYEIIHSFCRIISITCNFIRKMWLFVKTFFLTGVYIWLFCISLVPFTDVDRESQQNLWPVIHKWYSYVDKYQVANSYGLFRRMTGVGGRPELVIEGSNHLNGEWKEYNFLYKPGNISVSPSFVAPHQPRLDWQMWFAALGSYQHNPWFVHLIYKLLIAEKDVLFLLGENPFPDKPPLYIRSTLYTYHYTRLPKQTTGVVDGLSRSGEIANWWERDTPRQYTPALTKDDESLKRYIIDMGWKVKVEDEKLDSMLYHLIKYLRRQLMHINPTTFMLQSWLFTVVYRIVAVHFNTTRLS